jgi:hypothetical protein
MYIKEIVLPHAQSAHINKIRNAFPVPFHA